MVGDAIKLASASLNGTFVKIKDLEDTQYSSYPLHIFLFDNCNFVIKFSFPELLLSCCSIQ